MSAFTRCYYQQPSNLLDFRAGMVHHGVAFGGTSLVIPFEDGGLDGILLRTKDKRGLT